MGRMNEGIRSTRASASDVHGTNDGAAVTPSLVPWTSEAEARVERIPSFIRPMARRAIERFAAEHGYATIDEAVMDEARSAFGM